MLSAYLFQTLESNSRRENVASDSLLVGGIQNPLLSNKVALTLMLLVAKLSNTKWCKKL